MASTVTHAFFIEDLYKKFDIDKKLFLRNYKDDLRTFAQGMDPLNFYIKNKKIRKFASIFHTKKTGDFLVTLINYIKYNYYSNNPEIMAFLYGMLSHYVLDSNIHPYVYYKTGTYDPKNNETYKYNAKHLELETAIDKYLIEKRLNIKSYKFKHYKYCFNTYHLTEKLKDVINFSFKETYNIKRMDHIYIKSISNMKLAFKLLRYDPLGIKLFFYKIFDKITGNKFLNIKSLSYHYLNKNLNYLNEEHNEWHHPVNNHKYNSSFNDIYIKSLNKCLTLIKEVDNYIYDKNSNIDINKVIKNLSYKTGLDLNKNQELKYFEF